jgi:hypothetical protein
MRIQSETYSVKELLPRIEGVNRYTWIDGSCLSSCLGQTQSLALTGLGS